MRRMIAVCDKIVMGCEVDGGATANALVGCDQSRREGLLLTHDVHRAANVRQHQGRMFITCIRMIHDSSYICHYKLKLITLIHVLVSNIHVFIIHISTKG